jgi:hypothetical protein
MTDIVASEVYAARERLKTKALSNIKFGVLYDRRDIALLPKCNLLYSVLSPSTDPSDNFSTSSWPSAYQSRPEGLALLRAPTQHRLYQFMLPGTESADELNIIPAVEDI